MKHCQHVEKTIVIHLVYFKEYMSCENITVSIVICLYYAPRGNTMPKIGIFLDQCETVNA